ncbi:matrilin-1-like [Branchiostoma floridae x Branchiostoma belcheri]
MSGCVPPYTLGESCYYRCYNERGYAMEISGDPVLTCVWPGVCIAYQDFQQVKDFVAALVDQFDIGDVHARVGVLRYNHGPIVEFHLDAYSNKPDTLTHINGMPITTGGSTLTGAALTYVANTMLLPSNGSRADAPDVVIVLTDGDSQDSVTGPASIIHYMGATGVQTFAIGVGCSVSDTQLHDIANCDDHVYKLADFNGLSRITTIIHNQICCANNLTSPPCCPRPSGVENIDDVVKVVCVGNDEEVNNGGGFLPVDGEATILDDGEVVGVQG